MLGVSRYAPPEEIRRAYHELARVLHPDRIEARETVERDGSERRMQEINEAWRILRDPASRAAYDLAIGTERRRVPRPPRVPYPPAHTSSIDDDDDLDTPFHGRPAEPGDITVSVARALPWLVVAIVLGAIFIFTAFARKDDSGAPSPRALIGQCVTSHGAGMVAVPCDGPNDGKVIAVEAAASDCPSDTTARAAEESWMCLGSASQGATGTTGTTLPPHP